LEYFFSRIDGKQQNDKKLTWGRFWCKTFFILGWFPILVGFRVESHEILTEIFLNRTDEK